MALASPPLRPSMRAHGYGRAWDRWALRDVSRCAARRGDAVWMRASLAAHVLNQHDG
jgi:hypothetical protein